MFTLARSLPKSTGEWLVFATIAAFVVGVIVLSAWWDRKRRRQVGELLQSLGFSFDAAGFPFDEQQFEFICGNPLLKYERNAIKWLGAGDLGPRFVRVLEYQYKTGHGKGETTHVFLIVATDLPVQASAVVVERKRWYMAHRPSEKPAPLLLDDAAFNEAFAAFFSDPAAPSALLTPSVRSVLTGWDKKYWLQFRDGMLLLGWRGKPGPQDVQRSLDMLAQLAAAIEAETA
jgi:hypothetical protein